MDLKDKKNIIILSVSTGLLLLGGWFLFFRDSGVANDSLSETSVNPIENIIGQELLVSLEKMKQVKLDTTILKSDIYTSLIDFTVDIPDQPIGRRDPFAPVEY